MTDRKRTDPDWQDLRIFLALGRHGSLSAAARALSVNHATIARRVQSLEESLGEKLVERRPDGYTLTPAGHRALEVAGHMDSSAQTLGRDGADDAPRGLVRVNAPPALAQGFLLERLAPLTVRHPGLDIDLATDLRSVSLDRHKADIAVRMSRPTDGDFIARPLLTSLGFGYYGRSSACEAVEDGVPPSFVGFDEENSDMPEARWLSRHFPKARLAFRANNQWAQAQAARAGAGLALLPHYLGRQFKDLRPCLLGPPPAPRELWLLTRRQDRSDLPVRTVADHLLHLFDEHRALFAP